MDGKEVSVSGKSPSETIYGNPVRSIKINPLRNATEVSEDLEQHSRNQTEKENSRRGAETQRKNAD
jgi:hypothetical protein